MLKNIEIDLTYQPYIDQPPHSVDQLHEKACTSDKTTVDHWRETWLTNYKAAKDNFGSFQDKAMGQLYGINKHKPAIVIGSGPSLSGAIPALKRNAALDSPITTISCLHNFGYFEDEGVHADYYLSLDSGGVVIDDVSESRNKDGNFYWEATKGKTLLAYISSDPRLWDLWQGDIYLFNCLVPDPGIREEYEKVEKMTHYVSSGGNALGGCMYVAKAVMGSAKIIYVGADFCFSYNNQFHAYKTHYDTPGNVVLHSDVYGIPRKTWPSYLNFKFWFDKIAMTVPGEWVNASEGLLGAYLGGNLRHFQYMDLDMALVPYKISETVTQVDTELKGNKYEESGRTALNLKEYFGTSQYEKDLTLF